MDSKVSNVQKIELMLVPPFPKKNVPSLLKHFSNSVEDFRKGEWENAIAKTGKFIEATLKALFIHTGKVLPAGRGFKADLIINGLGQLPDGSFHDSIRLTIPRAARFVYDIASNRGARHDTDEVDPNEMDAHAAMMARSWILPSMIRLAQKGAVDLSQAKALVENLTEKRYPMIEEVEGHVYFHRKKKTATEVALVVLAHRYPGRIERQELVSTIKRNGFSLANARVAVSRILRMADENGVGELRLLAPGLKQAEELMKRPLNKNELLVL